MSDPTYPIIGIGYAVTLFIAVSCAAWQMNARRYNTAPPTLPQGRVAVWFYKPNDLWGPFGVFAIFGLMFALTAISPPIKADDIDAPTLIVNIGFQGLMTTAAIALALRRCTLNQWLGLRWQGWPWLFLIAPGAVILMLGIFHLLQGVGYIDWMESLGAETTQDSVQLLQVCQDPVILGLMVFTAVIVAPVCEEIIFRGYLYPILKKFIGMRMALFCSALLFSIAHSNLTVLLPLFILGALLAWLYEKTGSLWAPIAVHFCFNAVTVVAQLSMRFSDLPSDHLIP